MAVEFFLGANSAHGFHSLYGDFASSPGDCLRLIKGGPGCGKSSFMRKLAESAEAHGFEVVYILCSGDPESLDGVYFPELRIGYADATAPHILEPRFFGYDSDYVNLGRFCAHCDDERIPQLTEKYRAMYKSAYAYLSAAGSVKSAEIPGLIAKNTVSAAESCATSAAALGSSAQSAAPKRISERFIHSIGCTGEEVLCGTVEELCKHVYLIDDRLGLEKYYFDELLRHFGGRIIRCRSPLLPELTEALLLPDCGLGFVSASLMPGAKAKRRIRLDALVPKETLARHKDELRHRQELKRSLIAEACRYLEQAKLLHDELEACYRPKVDFASLDEFCAEEAERLFA